MKNSILIPLAVDSLYEEEDFSEDDFEEASLDDEESECYIDVACEQVIMDCVNDATCQRCGQHQVTDYIIKLCSPCQWVIGKIEGVA